MARDVLDEVLAAVKPGVTTEELDRVCHEATIARGAYPSPLNYGAFPKSLCTSVNEVICHGIPDDRPLEDGDIVNCDVTVYVDGVHGDTSETVFVGEVDALSRKLVQVTYECMMLGIEAVKPGRRVSVIGQAITAHARQHGFSVVRDFSGHGIGEHFHMAPNILHFFERRATKVIEPGMTFTVEPMINVGTHRGRVLADNWTAMTTDGKRSAQFEHTLLVHDDGVEILTTNDAYSGPWFRRH